MALVMMDEDPVQAETAQRVYEELNVRAVITGRRASQKADPQAPIARGQ